MNNTSMTVRTDKKIKQQAQAIFSELGMDMSTAVNVFLRQAIKHNGFPFELTLEMPNSETVEAFEEVKMMKANPSLGKTYTDVDAMMKELLADV